MHLAGHTLTCIEGREIRLDIHDTLVAEGVWEPYDAASAAL
jgi:uncharacterized protein (UPF0276 family)